MSSLSNPLGIEDLLLYRLSVLLATSGAPIVRLCEGKLGITWREWRVIASLGPDATMLSSELAEHTKLDRARTSRAVSSLLTKGLIVRATVRGDNRKASISLSDQGIALYGSFFPVVRGINTDLLSNLSTQDVEALERILKSLQSQAVRVAAMPDQPKANRRRNARK